MSFRRPGSRSEILWNQASAAYGELNLQLMMRRTIPAWAMLISGLQLIGNGFFLGILQY